MDRRGFLIGACSLAASPLVTPVAFAGAPGDNRLVVIVLRGAMDGLATVMPYGDPTYSALRGALPEGALDLDGYFALHPALGGLAPLWQAGQLGFGHAVSTPYRDKRSHFDGQDWLEAGITDMTNGMARDGWLNRALPVLGGGADTAWAIGNDALAILNGPAPVGRWSPDSDLALSPQAIRLAQLVMQDDPAMAAALAEAFDLADGDGDPVAFTGSQGDMMEMMRADNKAARGTGAEERMAEFAAARLKGDARIASFSINGWDTHAQQDRALSRALDALARTILTLQDKLGARVWGKTTVVAVTEFGRTVRLNGTSGTDHGTGGAMIVAGGAVRGGRVLADWPGLDEVALYERRDLMPTRDLRAHLGWLMRGLFGLERTAIERTIFPGLELGADPGWLA